MDWYLDFDENVKAVLPSLEIAVDEPMSRHTTFHIGGPARRMVFPKKQEEVVRLLELSHQCGVRPLILGNGSNLLVPDEGLDRLVIDLSANYAQVSFQKNGLVEAESGIPLSRLADAACKQSLTGLEFAHGIPGTLGGAVFMNAGAYGGEMSQVITAVTAWFPQKGVLTIPVQELHFSYRNSLFSERPDSVILSAQLRLSSGNAEEIRGRMKELLERRKASQPLEYPSAGSTFKRPVGHYAGALIEQCGLKGFQVGGAQVSTKHAGFVINTGNATCADVRELIHQVQLRVETETGVHLEPEVKII